MPFIGETDVKISIKTRIGKNEPEEFEHLLAIYNQYPLEELIVHPRVQQDFYKNRPRMEMFTKAEQESRCPVCYNGDIFCAEDGKKFAEQYPAVNRMMLGRGILKNPSLTEEMEGKQRADLARIRAFHDQIFEEYQERSMGEKNVLFKMKEIWSYLGTGFLEGEKLLKKIRKAEHFDRYEEAVSQLLDGE